MGTRGNITPIRVLHVLATLNRGGAENLVMNIYRTVDRSKVQFDFIVHYKVEGYFADEVRLLGGIIYVCPTFSLKNAFNYVKWWKKFFNEHNEYRIIHSHIRSTAALYLPIARSHHIKSIIHSHSTNNGYGISAIIKSILQFPLRCTADYYLACSFSAGKWLFGNKIASSNQFIVIPNAVIIEHFRFNDFIRQKMRAQLGLVGKRVFIHVGGLRAVKNHLFLLDVFKAVHSIITETRLICVGAGEEKDNINKRIHALNLSDSVIMLGSRSDVADLLQAADCFLLPSKWEGVPTSVIEAQASGLPCLISDRITEDVVISNAVKRLSIDKGTFPWVQEILKLSYTRVDVLDAIKTSGFDIQETTNKLVKLYQSIL